MAGISIPLGSARRAAPGIRAAEAELAMTPIEREAPASICTCATTAYGTIDGTSSRPPAYRRDSTLGEG